MTDEWQTRARRRDPVQNLDVLLGRGISVALDRVQTKLLTSRRGGYCHEHGVLFAASSNGSATASTGCSPASVTRTPNVPVHTPT